MAHKTFGNLFCAGVQTICSESVSDVKGSAGSIFGLNAEFFIQGYSRFDESRCQELLLGANGKYTKFALVLFPDPNNLCKDLFLKTASLAKILKVVLFGKSSLSGQNAPGPRPKGQIWELQSTTARMIAAAGILAIFILSGDLNFYQTGKKTGTPYSVYHNYFCQQLLSGTPWAKSVFKFFNDVLFPDTSNSTPASSALAATGDNNVDWEVNFKCVFASGLSDQAPNGLLSAASVSVATPSTLAPIIAAAAPLAVPYVPAIPALAAHESISAPTVPTSGPISIHPVPQAVPTDLDNGTPVDQPEACPPTKAKGGSSKSKWKGKANLKGSGATAAADDDDSGADAASTPSVLTARQSGRAKQMASKRFIVHSLC
ncbi:hypothetical protein J3R82DRAFT_1665 [Butyriboletus roseoflavus]|nr:hypothetical protein J3R82DRAFT_1665 [Butyriboletus roseoflavus]